MVGFFMIAALCLNVLRLGTKLVDWRWVFKCLEQYDKCHLNQEKDFSRR